MIKITTWFNTINKQTDIPFGYITIENELGEGVIRTREGWQIKVLIDKKIPEQFEELVYVLKNKVQRPNFNYIDLRYWGKVYWQ